MRLRFLSDRDVSSSPPLSRFSVSFHVFLSGKDRRRFTGCFAMETERAARAAAPAVGYVDRPLGVTP